MLLKKILVNDIDNIISFYNKNYEYLTKTDNVPNYKDNNFSHNMFDSIEKKKLIVYALHHNTSIIGMYYIEEINRSFYDCCTLSYAIDKDYASLGITTKSIKENISMFLNDAKVSKLKCTVSIENTASIRVLEKLNFKLFGPIPQYFRINGNMKDCYIAYSNID